MEKIMKVLILVLAAALVVCLTACGKTEEEMAREEILSHLEKEAGGEIPQDTIDWFEYAKEQQSDAAAQMEELQDEDDRLQAQVEAGMPRLQEAMEHYRTAADGGEILRWGQEFNRLYGEMLALTQTPWRQDVIIGDIDDACGRSYPIADYIIAAKAAFADSGLEGSWDSAHCYYNPDRGDARVALVRRDPATGLIDTVCVVMMDGRVCTLDLKAVYTDRTTHSAIIGMNGDSFLMYIVDNSTYINYEFKLDTSAPQAQVTTEGDKDYFWFDFGGTLADFSAMEPEMY